jgi:hypothetical protein
MNNAVRDIKDGLSGKNTSERRRRRRERGGYVVDGVGLY